MIVGFTGSQAGMTGDQAAKVEHVLLAVRKQDQGNFFHHGGCVGADVQAAFLARVLGYQTIRHPGNTPYKQSASFVDDVVLDVLPNLVRNREIVDLADFMIAAPDGPERQRSGTWATVRYARTWGKLLTIVMPDGSM